VAKGKFKKPKKGALPQGFIDQINKMRPEDLAIEAVREQNDLDLSKKQLKEDGKLEDLKRSLDKYDEARDKEEEVVEAQKIETEASEALALAKLNHMSKDHVQAKEDVAAYKKSWNDEIRQRSKKHKFMMKTLKKHQESGLLKSRLD
jgi:hypothetical protein